MDLLKALEMGWWVGIVLGISLLISFFTGINIFGSAAIIGGTVYLARKVG